jgi:hypothetical protein
MNPFEFLLSALYDGFLDSSHRDDLRRSGLTDKTIAEHKVRSVPPDMIDRLLGFPAPSVKSAYLIPHPRPHGGFMDHIRMKVFSHDSSRPGKGPKYLGPRGAPPRLFFPLAALEAVLGSDRPVWLLEGSKKALSVSQLGLPAVGFEGVEGWHLRGSRVLLPDFANIPLADRVVELLPDGDVATNPNVARGARRFADALRSVGARPRLVQLPKELAA